MVTVKQKWDKKENQGEHYNGEIHWKGYNWEDKRIWCGTTNHKSHKNRLI